MIPIRFVRHQDEKTVVMLRIDGGDFQNHLVETVTTHARQDGVTRIVLDMQHVTSLQASQLGAIVLAFGAVNIQKKTLVLLHIKKGVRDVLAITKLLTVISTFDSVEEAVKEAVA